MRAPDALKVRENCNDMVTPTMPADPALDNECINTLRFLSVDAVQKADSRIWNADGPRRRRPMRCSSNTIVGALTYEQAAAVTSAPVGTVKSPVGRADRVFRSCHLDADNDDNVRRESGQHARARLVWSR